MPAVRITEGLDTVSAPWDMWVLGKDSLKALGKSTKYNTCPGVYYSGKKKIHPLRYFLKGKEQAEANLYQKKIILKPHAFSKGLELEIIPEALCRCLAPQE